MSSGGLFKIRFLLRDVLLTRSVGTCGLNDSADLKCHTLSPLPAHSLSLSLSLSSDMQPTRRSSRLSKLKNVESDPPCVSETAPMNTSDIPLDRVHPHESRFVVVSQTVILHLRRSTLSRKLTDTPENRSKEQRYVVSRNVYQTKPQFYPELMRPQRMPMTGKFFSMAATERYKDLRGRKCIPQQCISLTDDNLSDVRRIVTGAGLIHTLTDIDPYQPNVVREFIANLPEAEEQDDGVDVYVRGSLVDFSPSLINSLYCIPGFEEDPLQGNVSSQ
ncbi:hypothetical protein DY000_02039216 [Brassica cretica]|uniref:Uncharacterized protein n=1 Tax=Brassica cretica TaxID=69181 RepID=A0ABQ7B8M1_BRACR|nr:hypothetical protein DY000_02039216 [Brassica cretica]